MRKVKVFLLSAIFFPALTGCLYLGDVDLACSGMETTHKNSFSTDVVITQRNRIFELSFIRENNSLKEIFEKPKYTIDGYRFRFGHSDLKIEENWISGRYTFQGNTHGLTFSKTSNILLFFLETPESTGPKLLQFEGVCSEQSRLLK